MDDKDVDIIAGIVLVIITILILSWQYCHGVESIIWIKGMGWVKI